MDLTEAKYKELRHRLFAVNLALEKSKRFENVEALSNLKKEYAEVKKELARFKTEQKERGVK